MGDKMRTLGDMLILVRVFPLPSVGIIYIYFMGYWRDHHIYIHVYMGIWYTLIGLLMKILCDILGVYPTKYGIVRKKGMCKHT